MKMLNDEFNNFRGLFPLKVYIGGPATVGKSYFASSLATGYGIPHLKILDMVHEAITTPDELGLELK
jgi:adenylate kinase family enzyme